MWVSEPSFFYGYKWGTRNEQDTEVGVNINDEKEKQPELKAMEAFKWRSKDPDEETYKSRQKGMRETRGKLYDWSWSVDVLKKGSVVNSVLE